MGLQLQLEALIPRKPLRHLLILTSLPGTVDNTLLGCFLLRFAGLPHDLDTFTVTFRLECGSQPLATLAFLSWDA